MDLCIEQQHPNFHPFYFLIFFFVFVSEKGFSGPTLRVAAFHVIVGIDPFFTLKAFNYL